MTPSPVPSAGSASRHDVAIVGAGMAGCAAAILLARLGLDILLVDKKHKEDDYKAACTTFIQPSALPVIRKLGLEEPLDGLGAIRNSAVFWTPFGWIRDPFERDEAYRHGYSIQRRKLDPLMLRTAGASPGVTVRLGARLRSLIEDDKGRFTGLRYLTDDGTAQEAQARLVVLADGRNSEGARLAGVPTTHRTNNRFVYFAYYRGMPLRTGRTAQFWQKGRDMGFAYPFDDDLTMLCCFVTHDQHDAWMADKFGTLERFFDDLPAAPDRSRAERASRLYGLRRLKDFKRPAAHRNLALIGDACMSCDPMSGVGCGFALQSADWLVECVGPALARGADLASPLATYKRRHRARLSGHEYFIQDNSNGRGMNLLEKLISRAAVADPEIAHRLHLFIARVIPWQEFLTPGTLLRILRSNVTYARNRERLLRYEPA